MKRSSILILICILVLSVFTLASCGNKKENNDKTDAHKHSYDLTVYQSDDTHHWYGATCEHSEQRLQVEAHSDADADGACDKCARVTCTHEYDEEAWSSDENGHWHAATCGCNVTKDSAPHADVDKNGRCDDCDFVTCTHETDDEWTSDEDGHWREYLCDCEIEPEKSEHKDSDKNGVCDTCEFVTCEHNPESKWTSDAYTHWHATDCGCDVRIDEAPHSYGADGFTCTICGKSCEHPAKPEWSSDETGHWHDPSCDHSSYTTAKEDHTDPDNDGACDVCGYTDSAHEHTFTLYYNKSQHYYLSTCEHTVAERFEDHTDEGEDGYCDVCGAFLGDIADALDSATSSDAAALVNGGNWTEKQGDYTTNHTYVYYKDYLVYTQGQETYYLSSYLNEGVPTLLKVLVEGSTYTVISDADIAELQGEYIDIMYGSITGYGLESFIYALYSFANDGAHVVYEYTEVYDPETGIIGFSFVYEEVNLSSGNSAQVFSVAFSVEDGAISTAAITAKSYFEGKYILDTDNDVCLLFDTNDTDTNYEYVFNQTVGERIEHTNPYSADALFITDLTIYNSATGEEIKDGDIVEISVGAENALLITLPEGDVAKAENNGINVSCADWSVVANAFSYPYKVYTINKAGDYTVTVTSNVGGTVTFTLRVNKIAPTKLSSAVVDGDGNKNKATSVEVFKGVSALIGAIASSEAGSTKVNVAVTAGNAEAVAFVEQGDNWLVVATESGTYTITLTSALNEAVSTSITLVVVDPPKPEEQLKGNYITETEDGTTVTVKLYPDYEGALSGTVKIIYDNNAFQNRLVINEIAKYVYSDGVITLTHTEGDGLLNIKELMINERYKIALVILPYGTAMDTEITYVLEKGPDDPNGTEKAPFLASDDTDVEAELDAGEYVHYLFTPTALGTLSINVLDGFSDFEILYSTVGFNGTMELMSTDTLTLDVSSDTTVYVKIGTKSGDAAKYNVKLDYEKSTIVPPTLENLAGSWEGIETNSGMMVGQTFTVTLELKADGTGTGKHSIKDIGEFKVLSISISGMNVTVTTDAKSINNVLYFVYTEGKLVNVEGKAGIMFGQNIILSRVVAEDEGDTEDEEVKVFDVEWSNSVNAPTAITEAGTYNVSVAAGEKGYFSIAYDVLASDAVLVTVSIDGGALYSSHPLQGDTAIPVSSISENVDSVMEHLLLSVGSTTNTDTVITVTITLAQGTPATA